MFFLDGTEIGLHIYPHDASYHHTLAASNPYLFCLTLCINDMKGRERDPAKAALGIIPSPHPT
jgi:hypothetical protein